MTSPYLTTADAARYLLFTDTGRADGAPDLVRLHQFLHRYRTVVRTVKRGRSVLVDRHSLEAHLNRESDARPSSNPVNSVERRSA